MRNNGVNDQCRQQHSQIDRSIETKPFYEKLFDHADHERMIQEYGIFIVDGGLHSSAIRTALDDRTLASHRQQQKEDAKQDRSIHLSGEEHQHDSKCQTGQFNHPEDPGILPKDRLKCVMELIQQCTAEQTSHTTPEGQIEDPHRGKCLHAAAGGMQDTAVSNSCADDRQSIEPTLRQLSAQEEDQHTGKDQNRQIPAGVIHTAAENTEILDQKNFRQGAQQHRRCDRSDLIYRGREEHHSE